MCVCVVWAAGLKSTALCVALLEHVRILYSVAQDSFVVPSLFQHVLPPRMRGIIRGRPNKGGLQWSSCREYRFNILPYKLAAALTVSVCASADLRSGAGSVMTWAEGVWLQVCCAAAMLCRIIRSFLPVKWVSFDIQGRVA